MYHSIPYDTIQLIATVYVSLLASILTAISCILLSKVLYWVRYRKELNESCRTCRECGQRQVWARGWPSVHGDQWKWSWKNINSLQDSTCECQSEEERFSKPLEDF